MTGKDLAVHDFVSVEGRRRKLASRAPVPDHHPSCFRDALQIARRVIVIYSQLRSPIPTLVSVCEAAQAQQQQWQQQGNDPREVL